MNRNSVTERREETRCWRSRPVTVALRNHYGPCFLRRCQGNTAPPRLAIEPPHCYHCHGEEALKRGRTRVSSLPTMGPRAASLSLARGGKRELEGHDESFCLRCFGLLRKGGCCLGASRSLRSTEKKSCGRVTVVWRAMLGRRCTALLHRG